MQNLPSLGSELEGCMYVRTYVKLRIKMQKNIKPGGLPCSYSTGAAPGF